MENTNKKSLYWDNIKGLLIILVVFAHILYQLQEISPMIDSIVDYIYMFHMPAFIFVSGYFGKSKNSHSIESIIKLIFLYLIFNGVACLLYGKGTLLEPKYSYWYLVALVVWRVLTPYLPNIKLSLGVTIALGLFVGFLPSINNTLAISRIICFYPFYIAGYLTSKEKSEKVENIKYIKRLLVGLAGIILAAFLSYFAHNTFDYSDSLLLMYSYSHPKDLIGRVALYVIATIMIAVLRCVSVEKRLPFITSCGSNSLWIFLFHRPITLVISNALQYFDVTKIIILSILSTYVICEIFGNAFVCKYMNIFADSGVSFVMQKSNKKFNIARAVSIALSAVFVLSVFVDVYYKYFNNTSQNYENENTSSSTDTIYSTLSAAELDSFQNAFKITFAGDLILLEDQVKRAYNGKDYDFSNMFEYTKKYIDSADLAIGVFEGPMAGEEAGYSTSNFDDSKELYLNFPDSFATAVKDAGFDLVTTANNHLLDKGIDGAITTLNTLDKIGLSHTGSYRNAQEKENERVKIIEKDGIKMAVLSYTYGCNYYENSDLISDEMSYLTSILEEPSSDSFEMCKSSVENDFEKARSMSPDLIIVLPHIGTQFSNEPDTMQKTWFEIFKDNGADIILGDHPHVIEPAYIESYNDKDVFVAFCPGNYANIYRENQGDTSALIDVYIDKSSKKIIGGGIVPLYTQSTVNGNYRAIPIYDIMSDDNLKNQLSTDDFERANNSNKIITNTVFGSEMDITSISEVYYFNKRGFLRTKVEKLELNDEMKDSQFYNLLVQANSICFLGDSITEGTKNGGCPWYEPLEPYLKGKTINNVSKGGCTVSYLISQKDNIPLSDLYVIAIGTNDVRYRDKYTCAMTANDFVQEIDKLKSYLQTKNPKATLIFIAPWYSTDGDKYCNLTYKEKQELNKDYCDALDNYCATNNLLYINANGYIQEKLNQKPANYYLLDHIHPNCKYGVAMFCEAVLLYS